MKKRPEYDIYAMGDDRTGYRTPDTLEDLDDFRFDKKEATRRRDIYDDPYKRDRLRRMSMSNKSS